MLLRRLHHVTRTFGQLPLRRSLSSNTVSTAPAHGRRTSITARQPLQRLQEQQQQQRRRSISGYPSGSLDPWIASSLSEMGVEVPRKISKGRIHVPKTLDPERLVVAHFAPGRHIVRYNDDSVIVSTARPRTVQRLAVYRERKALRPLWVQFYPSSAAAVVRSRARKRMQDLIFAAFRERGVDRYGFALNESSEDQKSDQKVPAVSGTFWITTSNSRRLATAKTEFLKPIADTLAEGVLRESTHQGRPESNMVERAPPPRAQGDRRQQKQQPRAGQRQRQKAVSKPPSQSRSQQQPKKQQRHQGTQQEKLARESARQARR